MAGCTPRCQDEWCRQLSNTDSAEAAHLADGLRKKTAFAESSTRTQRRILSIASEATCILLRSKWV